MSIFLDIGGHNGQTLEEITDPKYSWEHVYSFEPMPTQSAHLIEQYGPIPNVTICDYGLSDFTGRAIIYGTNDICEASVYATKVDLDATVHTLCDFMEASRFFTDNILTEVPVYVKMNCEGSEIPILNNLIDTGEIWKITAMTFDLDIRRCAGQEHQADELLTRFDEIGFDRYQISSEGFWGDTHREKISNWLGTVL